MKRIFSLGIIGLLLFSPAVHAFALTTVCPVGINCSSDTSLNSLILKVINWILSITLVVDVLFLIIGGFFYIISAGNEEREHQGKTTIINAIVGLIIIILSYVIAVTVANYLNQL